MGTGSQRRSRLPRKQSVGRQAHSISPGAYPSRHSMIRNLRSPCWALSVRTVTVSVVSLTIFCVGSSDVPSYVMWSSGLWSKIGANVNAGSASSYQLCQSGYNGFVPHIRTLSSHRSEVQVRSRSRLATRLLTSAGGALLIALPAILGIGAPLGLRIACAVIGAALLAAATVLLNSAK